MQNYVVTNLEDFIAGLPMKVQLEPLPEPVPQVKVIPYVTLKGQSIATVSINKVTHKIVIFHPTVSTHRLVKEMLNVCIDLSIEDTNGVFGPQRPQAIVDFVYESGNDTMIVTTEDQSC